MKYTSLLITIVLIIIHSVIYAQNKDTVQPDSLYRKYKVYMRSSHYEGSPSKPSEIFFFNISGMYCGFILTDNQTGKLPQLKLMYQYNNKGILIAENDTSFRSDEYQAKRAELSYDQNGILIKKVVKAGDEIEDETEYFSSEVKETEKLYRSGKFYREQTTYYDAHHKKIRFVGMEYADKNAQPKVFVVNGKTYTIKPQTEDQKWDYTFNNIYDNAGNLVKQQRLVDGKLQDETSYIYDSRGLLIEEQASNIHTTVKYEYSYYE